MNQNDIRVLIRNSLTQPFRICMDDGRSYEVLHPDFALASTDVVVVTRSPGQDFGATLIICPLEHISRVEFCKKPKSKAAKPGAS